MLQSCAFRAGELVFVKFIKLLVQTGVLEIVKLEIGFLNILILPNVSGVDAH